MATKVTVGVEKVYTRQTQTGKTLYSVKGTDGVYYGCGFDKPPCNDGDTVELEWYENDKGYTTVKKGTLKKVQAAEPVPSKPNEGGKPNGKFSANDKFREPDCIIYQESLEAAINATDVLLKHGAFALPKAKGDMYGAVVGLMEELAQRFSAGAKFVAIKKPEEEVKAKEVEGELVEEDGIPF